MHARLQGKFLGIAILTWATAAPALAQSEPAALQRAFERIDAYVAQSMQERRTPGLALALTSREKLLRVSTYGFADAKARLPVTPETLFEIGSISKSFTAIALLQLREAGKFDPLAPVTKYLPWFQIQSQFEPITSHHLLSHTAGIPRDRDDIPASMMMPAALRERSTGYAPGKKFSYSNIGYQTLSYLLEELSGTPYRDVIHKNIFEPVGMKSSEPIIRHATRTRLAVGYEMLYDDRPAHRSHPLVEATWLEHDVGDGSIAATPADLAAYLRMLLNHGAAGDKQVISEESFQLLIQPAIKSGEKEFYGYGMGTSEEDGHKIISHGGGMVGYSSMLRGDLDAGLGVIVFVNGPGSPGGVAEFALKCIRAAMENKELPALPPPSDSKKIPNAAEYAGIYPGAYGKRLVLTAEGESLWLTWAGAKIQLERRGKDQFFVPHPDFELFLLRFEREKPATGEKEGKVSYAIHGGEWFANHLYSGGRNFEFPRAWLAFAGHYRSHSPWLSNFRIVNVRGKLWLMLPGGGQQALIPTPDGSFQVGEEETAERISFETVVNGKALRAVLSGWEFYRSAAP